MNEEPTLPFDISQTDAGIRPQLPAVSLQWGDFRLEARVGVGGFGEVYRAWDPNLQRVVALKLLLPGSIGGEAEYESMLREARALASVRHPNIVPVYGIDRHDGRVGFWTDFVRGKTLASLVRDQGTFGAREAALIGLDVTKALSAVHRAGILHRDIKAENVMREEGGRILLMDFGLSSLQQRQTTLAGTPNYMAPELFEGGKATVATDIYAMGVLLYFLVTGTYPAVLTGASTGDSLARLAKRKPLMDARPDVPEPLLRAVNKATELDPAKRYLSAGQMAEALSESLGDAAPAVSEVPYAPVANRKTKGIARGMVLGVLIAAIVVASGYLLLRNARGRSVPPSTSTPQPTSGTAYEEYEKAEELLLRSYKKSNVAAAIDGFQKVLKTDPKFALAEAGLAASYFIQYGDSRNSKLLDQAREAANRAIALDANSAPAHVTLARIAATQGDSSLGMQEARKALDLDSRSAEAYGALAEVYEAEGKQPDAVAAYQKAIALAPEDWRWPVRLGVEEFDAGNLKESISLLERGVELAPDNAVAYYDMGFAKMHLDDVDGARKDFETSLKIESDSSTFDQLGSVFLFEGRYDDAAAMEQESIQLDGSDHVAWSNLGVAYLWSGTKHDQALEAFRKAVELGEQERLKSPKDSTLLVELANDYASLGDAAKSVILIREALALSPDDPSVEFRAGEAYESLGRRGEAIGLIGSAQAQGYGGYELKHNPELAGLRADPAFVKAQNEAKHKKK